MELRDNFKVSVNHIRWWSMKVTMNDSRITTINQLRAFLKGNQGVDLSIRDASIEQKYELIRKTVKRFKYWKLKRKEKRLVLVYLKKLTGYRKTHLVTLITRALHGKLKHKIYQRTKTRRIYETSDIKLLEQTDELHLRLSERATKKILEREHQIFKQNDYQTISKISHSHITNLRHHPVYQTSWVNHTKARLISIGETMPPQNNDKPGSIRVDTVHQRDVYHINSVDEITQWEIVVCVPQISELFMIPALETMLAQYPFRIFNFHSDRGGETINYKVADLLQRLVIKQTKSRARKAQDNALVETKNGHVVRKNMGWEYINQDLADQINDYYQNYFNPYLNYHRPCAYPTIKTNDKGKTLKIYDHYEVPYEVLKSIKGSEQLLKPGISFEKLDKIAYAYSDNQWAAILRKQEKELFKTIKQYDHRKDLSSK